MGPLQVSDHMAQKPPYWNANCPLGHLKQRTFTVFIWLQAERFLQKSSLSLGKFEAVEGVSAYSRVFFIKKNFSAN